MPLCSSCYFAATPNWETKKRKLGLIKKRVNKQEIEEEKRMKKNLHERKTYKKNYELSLYLHVINVKLFLF